MSNMTPTLGQIMKKARLEQRLTQEEISERIGCHPQYYKNLENDKGTPSIQLFCTIMRTLNISADSYVYTNRNANDPYYQKITQLLGQCNQYQLSVLLATAEALVRDNSSRDNDT